MVELLWFIQTGIFLGGYEIHQAPWEEKSQRKLMSGRKTMAYFSFLFLYSVNYYRIFRIPELFTE